MASANNNTNGVDEGKYAYGSHLQAPVMSKAKLLLQETVRSMFSTSLPSCITVVDLGCSAASNSLLFISEVMDAIDDVRRKLDHKEQPELQVFLNDLPQNDFNNLFRMLPPFYNKLHKESRQCYVAGVPGTFYGRLFPSKNLHLFHCSFSLHWTSKVPEGLEEINKGNVCISKTSPPEVFQAYLRQFEDDFSVFLSSRAEEIMAEGRMVLTLMGRGSKVPGPASTDCCIQLEILSKSLSDLVEMGLVKREDYDSYNVPTYSPYKGEVEAVIEKEGSFNLDKMEVYEVDCHPNYRKDDKDFINKTAETIAVYIRELSGKRLADHFGSDVLDQLFERYVVNAAEHLSKDTIKYVTIVVSLSKKK